MAIVRMKKISAITLKQDLKTITKALQRLGAVEISKSKMEESTEEEQSRFAGEIEALEQRLQDLNFVLGIIKRYDHTKTSFFAPKPLVELSDFENQEENIQKTQQIIDTSKEIEGEISKLKHQITKLNTVMQQIRPFESLEVPLEQLKPTAQMAYELGFVPLASWERVEQICHECDDLLEVEKLGSQEDIEAVLVMMHQSVRDKAFLALKEEGFIEARFDRFSGTCREQLNKLESQVNQCGQKVEELEKQAAQFAESKQMLQLLYEYTENELDKWKASSLFGATDATYMINGYIKEHDASKVEQLFQKELEGRYYLELSDPAEDEDIPTALENPKLIQPFEAVTDMYSVPSPRGLDPNKVMAPFYFLFFGMMLSDAGYGVVMSIGCTILLFIKKPSGMMKKIITLLAICGISTVIWGILFGGWFGFSVPPLMFNPMDEPINMLILCLGLGAIHIVTGLIVGAYMNIRRGQVWDAIFDQGFWILVFVSIPFFVLPGLSTVGMILVIISVVGLLCTQGRHKKGIVKKVVGGLASLYDVTSYLSDVLSYCRIFGLALATSVIAMVFNTISEMLTGSWIGYIFAAAVFLIGHIFNIAINALGSYVHTSRLQYIEFFNKFYEGGGRAFKPLGIRLKNFRMENK